MRRFLKHIIRDILMVSLCLSVTFTNVSATTVVPGGTSGSNSGALEGGIQYGVTMIMLREVRNEVENIYAATGKYPAEDTTGKYKVGESASGEYAGDLYATYLNYYMKGNTFPNVTSQAAAQKAVFISSDMNGAVPASRCVSTVKKMKYIHGIGQGAYVPNFYSMTGTVANPNTGVTITPSANSDYNFNYNQLVTLFNSKNKEWTWDDVKAIYKTGNQSALNNFVGTAALNGSGNAYIDEQLRNSLETVKSQGEYAPKLWYLNILCLINKLAGNQYESLVKLYVENQFNDSGQDSFVIVDIVHCAAMWDGENNCPNVYSMPTWYASYYNAAPASFYNSSADGTKEHGASSHDAAWELADIKLVQAGGGKNPQYSSIKNWRASSSIWSCYGIWQNNTTSMVNALYDWRYKFMCTSLSGKLKGNGGYTIYADMGYEIPKKDNKVAVCINATPDNQNAQEGDALNTEIELTLSAGKTETTAIITKMKSKSAPATIILQLGVSGKSDTVIDTCATGTFAGNKITITDVTPEQMQRYLEGADTIKLVDTGFTMGSTNIEAKYTVQGTVQIIGVDDQPADITAKGKKIDSQLVASDTASWIAVPETPHYYSVMEDPFVEIKQGSPDDETYEAMAGVPTTETLYVGYGGTEFMVNEELEYSTQGATRTYTITISVSDCWKNDEPCPVGSCAGHGYDSETGKWDIPPGTHTGDLPCGSTSCNHSQKVNHFHPESHTWTYKVTQSIDEFAYMDIKKLEMWRLDNLIYEGNGEFLVTPNHTWSPNTGYGAYYSKGAYSSGNGRLYFSKSWNTSEQYGNTTKSGSVSSGLHDDLKQQATDLANSYLPAIDGGTITAISDYIYLATTEGFQIPMYYVYDSQSWTIGQEFPLGEGGSITAQPVTWSKVPTKEEMWDNNGNSAAKWDDDHITRSGYNGDYSSPNTKWNNTNSTTSSCEAYTKWIRSKSHPKDAYMGHSSFSSSGKRNQRLTKTGLEIINSTDPWGYPDGEWSSGDGVEPVSNGVYDTGHAYMKYTKRINYGRTGGTNWDTEIPDLAKWEIPYSSKHTEINDIVIFNPTSAENAILISNDDKYDFRYYGEMGKGGDPVSEANGCPNNSSCQHSIMFDLTHLGYGKTIKQVRDEAVSNSSVLTAAANWLRPKIGTTVNGYYITQDTYEHFFGAVHGANCYTEVLDYSNCDHILNTHKHTDECYGSATSLTLPYNYNGYTITYLSGQGATISIDPSHTYKLYRHGTGCSYNGYTHLWDVTLGKCLCCTHSCTGTLLATLPGTDLRQLICSNGYQPVVHTHNSSCGQLATSGTFTYAASGTTLIEFTAPTSGTIGFYSTSYTADPRGQLYIDGSLYADNDDGGNNLNFNTGLYSVSAGQKVKLVVYRYGSAGGGTINYVITGTLATSGAMYKCGKQEGKANSMLYTTYGNGQSITLTPGTYEIELAGSRNTNGGAYGTVVRQIITVPSTTKFYYGLGNGGVTYFSNTNAYTGSSGYNGYGGGLSWFSSAAWNYGSALPNSSYSMVAGGAGGASHTHSGYATFSAGGNTSAPSVGTSGTGHGGGGGGGYRGGKGGSSCAGGGYAGSSYAGSKEYTSNHSSEKLSVTYGGNNKGVQGSNYGYLKVTEVKKNNNYMNSHAHTANCEGKKKVIMCNNPHHYNAGESWSPVDATSHYSFGDSRCYIPCGDPDKHKPAGDVTDENGAVLSPLDTFINIDREFVIYWPTTGDFAQSPTLHGISEVTNVRGMGYEDNMDVGDWTRDMYVQFPVDVNTVKPNGTILSYKAGEYIWLNQLYDNDDYYEFYAVLGNHEFSNADVTFLAIATNAMETEIYDESDGETNRERDRSRIEAAHTATRKQYIDVIGSIGSLTLNDTGDYRFSELFKETADGSYLVDNLVHKVDSSSPNYIVGSIKDVRGEVANASTKYHATYGVTTPDNGKGKAGPFITFPLTPSDNNIDSLYNQPVRPGYTLFMDIETIGDYYGETLDIANNFVDQANMIYKMDVSTRYWLLNVDTSVYTPLDVYMGVNGNYKMVNKFDATKQSDVATESYVYLNFQDEKDRRTVTQNELAVTEHVIDKFAYYNDVSSSETETYVPGSVATSTNKVMLRKPTNYDVIGTSNFLFLNDINRTFIGSTKTYGVDRNPNDYFDDSDYMRQSQRWHFNQTLPSSSVFVESGRPCNTANIEAISNQNGVIVCAMNIRVRGLVWQLEYDGSLDNASENGGFYIVGTNKKFYPPKDTSGNYITDPVVAVFSNKYTSKDDLRTEGSH